MWHHRVRREEEKSSIYTKEVQYLKSVLGPCVVKGAANGLNS